MQKVGGGGNGGAISAPFSFTIALLCFFCVFLIVPDKAKQERDFIRLLACMSIGWKE
jgi:hypothetical protein